MQDIILNNQKIKLDSDELVSLTDMWKASGLGKDYMPIRWARSESANRFISYIRDLQNHPQKDVFYTKRGRTGGTFGHWQIALAYAQWLSPEFKAQVQDAFRSYKIGDPEHAGETLDNQYKSGNLSDPWANKRVEGKASRNHFTSIVALHGGAQALGLISNGIYKGCLGKKARELRKNKGLPANPSKPPATRDSMSYEEVTAVKMSEDLAALRMIREGAYGIEECREISEEAGSEIQDLINE